MLRHASAAARGRARLVEADLTDLPPLGSFDLALCLNDVCDYLATSTALRAAAAGLAANLRPGGVLLMDANTPMAFRACLASTERRQCDGRIFVWTPRPAPPFVPGARAVIDREVFVAGPGETYRRVVSRHTQVRHPHASVLAVLDGAGFDVVGVFGPLCGAVRAPSRSTR